MTDLSPKNMTMALTIRQFQKKNIFLSVKCEIMNAILNNNECPQRQELVVANYEINKNKFA